MSKHFKAKVNDTLNFEIQEEDVSNLDAQQVSENKYHILQDNKPYSVEFIQSDFYNKAYQVKVNNNTYKIDILNQLDLLINNMGFTIGSEKQIDSIIAPMPGLILEINVEVNQEVKENDPLIILEAMKMENVISSPRDGIIKSISIKLGDAAEKNQLLIEFQ